jgi:hypothetical protein
VRARIGEIVAQMPAGTVLETNICSMPTRKAADLRRNDRVTEIFRWLIETIKPNVVYAHSNEPIEYFKQLTGCCEFDQGTPKCCTYAGHRFSLIATRGPLYRMGFSAARGLGNTLNALVTGSNLTSGCT